MATYKVEYTLPGTMGKVQKKSFSTADKRQEFINEQVKAKGGKVKATVTVNA